MTKILKTHLLLIFFLRLNIYVPWNEVVVLDPIILGRADPSSGSMVSYGPSHGHTPGGGVLGAKTATCQDHDFDTMKPLVLATWKQGFQVGRR